MIARQAPPAEAAPSLGSGSKVTHYPSHGCRQLSGR